MGEIHKVVVIGCSGTGALAARMIKKLASFVDVVLIREEEEKGLLTRCATPYICCGNVLVNPSYKDDGIFTSQGITLVNVRAERIDRDSKTVTTSDGESYEYDKLVLATGAQSVVPAVSGVDLPGVFTLRTSKDAFNILSWMNDKRVASAVLVGAGAVGLEISYLLAQKGVKITLVEMLGHVLPKVLDSDMSAAVQDHVEKQGVDLRLKRKVTAIRGEDRVRSVVLDSGDEIDAEMIVMSAGVRPRSELAEKAGLEMGLLGLKVNRYLQTSDPDIYAAGDLIEYPSFITGKPILGQLRPNAVIGGRVIAKNILGREIEYPSLVNGFATKFFDMSIAGTGITEQDAAREGMDVLSSVQTSASKHSMMREKKPYVVKLIFSKRDQKIVGGQIVSDSECPIKNIDTITVAIRSGWTALQLATLRCAGQPELSPDPGKEPLALAAEEADMIFCR